MLQLTWKVQEVRYMMACKLEPWLIVLDFIEFILALIFRAVLDFILLCTSPIWYIIEAFQSASPRGTKQFNSILITGASGGIGQAVAIEFVSKNPNVTLFLLGRDKEKLERTKELCLQQVNVGETNDEYDNDDMDKSHLNEDDEIQIHCFSVDNTNKKEVEKIINKCDDIKPIDLLFSCAGITNRQIESNDWFDRYQDIVNVNIIGTFNTVFPVMKKFLKRKRGHIAFNASIASYQVLLGSTSVYSATQVFIRFMCQTLAVSLMYYGIDCTVINLGWIDTDMIAPGARKFAKSKETTATVIVNGLYRNKSSIHYPFHFSFLMWYIGGLHPVINNCIAWISMPGPGESNHVFENYIDDNDDDDGEDGDDYHGNNRDDRNRNNRDKKKQRKRRNYDDYDERKEDQDDIIIVDKDDNKERAPLMSDEDK